MTSESMGFVHLGMTVAEARKAFSEATFTRSTDGDGAALIDVSLGKEVLIILYTGEEDPHAPLDEKRKIDTIETFNPICHTAEGIHPETLVFDAEKILGKTTEIVKSEIESREYISFEKQPKHMSFRLDYSGMFPDGTRSTMKHSPDSKIWSIAVSIY